jgi:copper transport protein
VVQGRLHIPSLKAALVALAAGALLALPAPAAFAHSMLVRADPAPDSSLVRSPQRLLLTFSEPPDPALSRVEIVDSGGTGVRGVGAVEPGPGNARELEVMLSRALPDGVYTVSWRAVSAVDGHAAAGSYAFGVGVAPPSSGGQGNAMAANSTWLTTIAAVGRWMLYCALALMVGAASTTWLVLGGAVPARSRLVLWPAAVLALAGALVILLAQRAIVGVPSLLPLFQTDIGKLLGAQGVAAIFCVAAIAAFSLWPRRSTLAVVGLLAAGAMFVHVLLGHANALSPLRPLRLAEQWVHIVAIGVWLGGLVWLVVAVASMARQDRVAVVWRFSRVATVGLVVVLLTGILRSLTELGSLGNLFTTTFGVALVIKVGLVVVLVALGALNHFWLVPALRRNDPAGRYFRWTTRGEIGLAAVILAVTALLSGLVPASVANVTPTGHTQEQGVARGADFATTVRARLTAKPGAVGQNVFVVRLRDYDSGEPLAARKVQLVFSLPSQPEVRSSTLDLGKGAPGVWRGGGMQLSIAGAWHVEVVIQGAASGTTVPLELRVGTAATH